MPESPRTGALADAIRVAWHHFANHAQECQTCGKVAALLRSDPDHHDRPFGRHRERHDACCEASQRLLKPWIKAVNAQVKALSAPRLTQ